MVARRRESQSEPHPARPCGGEEATMPRRSNDGTALVQTTLVVAAGLLVLVLVVIAVAMQFGGS